MSKTKKKPENNKEFQDDSFKLLAAPDVEEIVLGAIMLEKEAIHQIGGDFSVDLFYSDHHVMIANAIIQLFLKNECIDIITVTDKIRKNEQLDKVGGPSYISSLTNRVASSANLEKHIKILQQYSLSRKINEKCNKARSRLFNKNNDVFDIYGELISDLETSMNGIIKQEVESVKAIHERSIVESYNVIESGSASGVLSGQAKLDKFTNGWQKSDLIILAGRPGMGKTAEAITIALNASVKYDTPVAFFSLEMSKSQLVGRMQSQLSGIDVSKIIKKQVSRQELEQIDIMSKALYTAPLYVDDTPSLKLVELKVKARKMVREKGVKLIVIDYLQLMSSGMQLNSREQEVSEISKGLKALAKELDVPVIALSQLSRGVEARGGDKKPMLSDLRESGQIEADADMVVFAYRPEYYGIDSYVIGNVDFNTKGLFMLIIAKHRNGGIGEIPLNFIHEQTLVKDFNEYGYKNVLENQNISGTFVQHNNETTDQSTSMKPNTDFDAVGNDDIPF